MSGLIDLTEVRGWAESLEPLDAEDHRRSVEVLALVEAVSVLDYVVRWIRYGEGDESTAAEKADAALARFKDYA